MTDLFTVESLSSDVVGLAFAYLCVDDILTFATASEGLAYLSARTIAPWERPDGVFFSLPVNFRNETLRVLLKERSDFVDHTQQLGGGFDFPIAAVDEETFDDDACAFLAENVRSVTELNLRDCRCVTLSGITDHLARLPRLANLTLPRNGFAHKILDFAVVMQRLVEGDCEAIAVELLRLRYWLTQADALMLFRDEAETLDLSGIPRILDDDLRFLATRQRLTSLDLSRQIGITAQGIAQLIATSPSLRELRLARCQQLDDAAIGMIAVQSRGLESLDLSRCWTLTAVALEHLSAMPTLKFLRLAGCVQLLACGSTLHAASFSQVVAKALRQLEDRLDDGPERSVNDLTLIAAEDFEPAINIRTVQFNSSTESLIGDPMAIKSFENMGLKDDVLRGIFDNGFVTPSQPQTSVVPRLLVGRDMCIQCGSGTGRTAATVIAAVNIIDVKVEALQVLKVCPTREIAIGVTHLIRQISNFVPAIAAGTECIEMPSTDAVTQKILTKPTLKFLVAVIRQLVEVVNRGWVSFDALQLVIFTEVEDICSRVSDGAALLKLIKTIPRDAQLVMITDSPPNSDLMQSPLLGALRCPVIVKQQAHLSFPRIRHFFVDIEKETYVDEVIVDIVEMLPAIQLVITTPTRRRAEALVALLRTHFTQLDCDSVHSQMGRTEINDIGNRFRSGRLRILVDSTCGLFWHRNPMNVALIVNTALPPCADHYVGGLRAYLTSRGRSMVINLITGHDRAQLKGLEDFFAISMEELPMNFVDLL